jgi:hypothetical protein
MTEMFDSTQSQEGAAPAQREDVVRGVLGGDADRMDSPGAGSGGVPGAGADGETEAREQLRKDLGERAEAMGTEAGDDLEQAAAIGEPDDPQGGSIQQHGSRPA